MAIAAEALSPEATEAVSAAAAGRGSHLTPEVAKELRRRVVKRATTPKAAKSTPARSTGPGIAQPVARAASAINDQGAQAISGGHGGTAARIIFAFGAGLLALELASYLSGRYFTYSLKAGATRLQTATQHVGLYPGQTAKLTASRATDTALAHYGQPV